MAIKFKEHEAYTSLEEAIEDTRLSRHISYIPSGELSGDNLIITVEKVNDQVFSDIVNNEADYKTGVDYTW